MQKMSRHGMGTTYLIKRATSKNTKRSWTVALRGTPAVQYPLPHRHGHAALDSRSLGMPRGRGKPPRQSPPFNSVSQYRSPQRPHRQTTRGAWRQLLFWKWVNALTLLVRLVRQVTPPLKRSAQQLLLGTRNQVRSEVKSCSFLLILLSYACIFSSITLLHLPTKKCKLYPGFVTGISNIYTVESGWMTETGAYTIHISASQRRSEPCLASLADGDERLSLRFGVSMQTHDEYLRQRFLRWERQCDLGRTKSTAPPTDTFQLFGEHLCTVVIFGDHYKNKLQMS